jgi:hypothetical protein
MMLQILNPKPHSKRPSTRLPTPVLDFTFKWNPLDALKPVSAGPSVLGEQLAEEDLSVVFDSRTAGGAVATWVTGVVKDLRREREFATEAEAAVAVGPDSYCSPRHLVRFNSRNEGLRCGG